MDEKMLDLLQRIDFFSRFTTEEKRLVAASSHQFVIYQDGEAVVKEGEADRSLVILLTGGVEVVKAGQAAPLARIGAGEFIGEIAFVTGAPRSTGIVAKGRVVALRLDPATLQRMPDAMREKVKDRVIQKLAERLLAMNAHQA